MQRSPLFPTEDGDFIAFLGVCILNPFRMLFRVYSNPSRHGQKPYLPVLSTFTAIRVSGASFTPGPWHKPPKYQESNNYSDPGGNREQPSQPLAPVWRKGSHTWQKLPDQLLYSEVCSSDSFHQNFGTGLVGRGPGYRHWKIKKMDLGFSNSGVSLNLAPFGSAILPHQNSEIPPFWLWPEPVPFPSSVHFF